MSYTIKFNATLACTLTYDEQDFLDEITESKLKEYITEDVTNDLFEIDKVIDINIDPQEITTFCNNINNGRMHSIKEDVLDSLGDISKEDAKKILQMALDELNE